MLLTADHAALGQRMPGTSRQVFIDGVGFQLAGEPPVAR